MEYHIGVCPPLLSNMSFSRQNILHFYMNLSSSVGAGSAGQLHIAADEEESEGFQIYTVGTC